MDISEALFARAQRVLPGGVNSPVRAYRSVGIAPRFIHSAQGSTVTDADGVTYIDYVGSWGPMILGHNHPNILQAVKDYRTAMRRLKKHPEHPAAQAMRREVERLSTVSAAMSPRGA